MNTPTAPGLMSARGVAHGLAGLLGIGNLAGAIASLIRDAPAALVATLLVAGLVMPVLAWSSYRGSRAAWAFLVAMCAVFAVTYLFGTPKVARGLSIPFGVALIAPVLYAAAAFMLGALHRDYGTSEPSSAGSS